MTDRSFMIEPPAVGAILGCERRMTDK